MDDIIRGVKNLLTGNDEQNEENVATPEEQGQYGGSEVLSSNQDPYGDPGQDIRSSNEDPYGDPGANVKSSDEDPYGDPGLQR